MREKMMTEVADDEVITAVNALSKLTRLRQIAGGLFLVGSSESSAKIDAVVDLIDDMSKPVVVFSNFVGMVYKLYDRLPNGTCRVITGETPAVIREKYVTEFQKGEYQVLGITTQTGGTGITLTRADTVVFLDKPWSPAIQTQAEDRIHRIGQEATSVHVISFIALNTVEEKMELLLRYKRGLMERLTGKEFKELL
jgi:SNF2 family DNA or RNA helicase